MRTIELDLLDFANLDCNETGLDGIIYISSSQDSQLAMVKWYPGRPGLHSSCISVTISITPVTRNHNLPKPIADRITLLVEKWIVQNYEVLVAFWQHGTSWTRKEVNTHLDQLKKL